MGDMGAVLVVDDEPDIASTIADYLRREVPGLDVHTAGSAVDAMSKLLDEKIDVLVTDYRMPDIDGIQLIRRVREKGIDIEIIMVTAYPDLRLAMRAVNDYEVRNFINKPVDPKQMLKMVVRAADQVMLRRIADDQLMSN